MRKRQKRRQEFFKCEICKCKTPLKYEVLGINLAQEKKELYKENCKKEKKKTLRKT